MAKDKLNDIFLKLEYEPFDADSVIRSIAAFKHSETRAAACAALHSSIQLLEARKAYELGTETDVKDALINESFVYENLLKVEPLIRSAETFEKHCRKAKIELSNESLETKLKLNELRNTGKIKR